MRTKPPAVRHFLYVDPRTGARRVLTKIDPRAPDCAPPLAEMVQSFSLPARIAELRKEADALPDAYPEKAEMLYRLELASKLTGDSRLLRVSQAETALANARWARDGAYQKRRAGGLARGEQQAEEARHRYEPFLPVYRAALAAGKKSGTALAAMRRAMEAKNVKPPSPQKMRAWLKKWNGS